MKKLYFTLQIFLFISFNFFLLLTGYQIASSPATMERMSYDNPSYNGVEEFDPSLGRLNSPEKLTAYCDSLFAEKVYAGQPLNFELNYPDLVSSVVRQRFYHGYSVYGFSNNYMAMLLSQFGMKGLSAIVIPDDILKYPFAACSQQSLVVMDVLDKKGFPTRKVEFMGKKNGHFCFEVYYNGTWHFNDPDMEPDLAVLNAYNRPGIQFLVHHKDILLKAYNKYPSGKILDIFPNYFYGPVNKFPAPGALLFQKITKFFSYTFWAILMAAFIFVRRKYLQISRSAVQEEKIYIPNIQTQIAARYYPKYSA